MTANRHADTMPAPDRGALARIRHLYFNTTRASIERDLKQAVALFTSLPTDQSRQAAAVFMDGLSQMRSEWAAARTPRRHR